MYDLPNLILDLHAQLIIPHGFSDTDVREKLLSSMHRGDRFDFISFCAEEFDDTHSDFRLYQLCGFYGYEFAFLEKDRFRSDTVNIVYFSSNVSDFHSLMSPYSEAYRGITGRCMYELLCLGHEKSANASFLTPAAFLTLDQIPHLRDDILDDSAGSEFCDLRYLTEMLIGQYKDISAFGRTEFSLEIEADAVPTPPIIEFSAAAYVYLFASLIHIYHAASEDHVIGIKLSFSGGTGTAVFSAKVSPARNIPSDMSSTASLGSLVPSMDSIAKVASIVSFGAHIGTSLVYDEETHTLKTTLRLGNEIKSKPKFHYRDPYADVSAMVEEFNRFMQVLCGAA